MTPSPCLGIHVTAMEKCVHLARPVNTTDVVTQQAGTEQTKPNHTRPGQTRKNNTARQLPPANSDRYVRVCQFNQSFHLGEDTALPGRAEARSKKQLSAPGSRQWG
ncbi:hypothetical protein Q5P01_007792 [Channa striata]|uniref:Uncharacterized protein n=1 Tax=Channa striata TaxID=64152 RepID=A0AA88SWN1_CHASR|nr:hypothetical protein Q5P01_007792 [Channa striata]